MPTSSAWIDPALFFERGGVHVYRVYIDNDVNQGRYRYWFTTNPLCEQGGAHSPGCPAEGSGEDGDCRSVFDVRELPSSKGRSLDTHQDVKAAVEAAIDAGVVTASGVLKN